MPFFTFTNSTCLDWFWQQKKFVASSTGSQSVPFQLSALNRISSLNISQRKQSSCFSWQRKLGIFDSRRSYHNKSNYTISGAQRTNRMINKSFSQNNRLIKNFKYLFSPEQISGFLLAEKPKFLKAPSKFAIKLRESRKIRSFYGNLSLNYFKKIIKKSNYGSVYQKNDSILTLLESRLDVVLYRSGFFESIATAKQWIFAFGVYINQKKVSSPAVLVLPGDIISLLPSTRIRKQNQSSNNLLSYNDARIMNAAVASAKLMQASAKPMQNLDIQYKNKASTHFSAINYFAFFEVAPRILHNFVTQIANIRKADLSMVLPSLANFALILRCKIMQNHAKPRNKELFFGVRFIEKLAALYAKREAFRFFVDGQVSSTQWGVQQEWEKQLPQNRYSNSKANSRTAAQSKIRLSMRNISKMGSISKIGYTNKVDVQVDEKAEIQSNIHTDIIPYYRERSGVLHLSEFSFRVEQMTCFISSFYKFDKQIESLSPTLPNDKFSQFKRKQKKWRFKATAFRVALQRSSLKTFSKQSKKSVIFAKEWIENRFYKTNNKNVKLKHTNIVETLLSSKKYWLSPSQAFSFFNRDIKSEDFSHSLFLQFDLGLQDTLKFKRKEKSFLQHQESILGQHELSHDGASQFKNQEKNSKLSTISAPKDNCLYAFVFLNYTLFLKKQLLYLTAKKCKVAKGKKRQNIKFHDDNTATTSFSKQIPNQNQRTNKKERLFRLKVLPFYSETTEKQKAICFEKQKDISFFKGQHFFVSKKAKPLHLEISYKSLSVVFLFNPQRICFPFFINVSHIYK